MAYQMSLERIAIQQQIEDTEDLRNWPGRYFPAKIAAEKKLAAWRDAHPQEAAAEDEDRAARAAARQAERDAAYKSSFLGKGID